MTESKPASAPARLAPAGLMFLAVTSLGWGFNWPVTKYLISELPPLTLRGGTGVIGAVLLALLALARGQSLKVAPALWPRLMLAALLNVTVWMALMGLALVFLPASETALIAYTMPVWAAMLAWPVLGERPTVLRTIALVMAFAGLAVDPRRQRHQREHGKAAGHRDGADRRGGVRARHGAGQEIPADDCRRSRPPPGRSGSAACRWRSIGLAVETTHLGVLDAFGWWLIVYMVADPVLPCLCLLVRRTGPAAGLGGGDRHHGGAGDRRGGLRDGAARAARPGPDRSTGLHAGRRRAGGAVVRRYGSGPSTPAL